MNSDSPRRPEDQAPEAVPPRVTVVSRDGCHLCGVAEEAVERIVPGDWTRVNVEDSPELERDYGDRVPVILLDGKEHGYWRVEEERLRRDLAKAPGSPRL